METFSALLAICAGNSPVSGEFPTQRPVTRNFDVYFDLHPNKWLSKQSEAGNLRRHCTHYDVTVMYWPFVQGIHTVVTGLVDCHHKGPVMEIFDSFTCKYW